MNDCRRVIPAHQWQHHTGVYRSYESLSFLILVTVEKIFISVNVGASCLHVLLFCSLLTVWYYDTCEFLFPASHCCALHSSHPLISPQHPQLAADAATAPMFPVMCPVLCSSCHVACISVQLITVAKCIYFSLWFDMGRMLSYFIQQIKWLRRSGLYLIETWLHVIAAYSRQSDRGQMLIEASPS